MSWISKIGNLFRAQRGTKIVRARYDAAQTTVQNANHWANADTLSPDAAITPEVRRRLRSRSRYEVANNAYAAGIVTTIASDVVSTGPTLQATAVDFAGVPASDFNSWLEGQFDAWAREIRLADKLRTLVRARLVDGEAFAMSFVNPKLVGAIKLDVAIIEADRVADPSLNLRTGPQFDDGIKYDEFGNPVSYSILNHHPGSTYASFGPEAATVVDAAYVRHLYSVQRPGQRRGVPEFTPVLGAFAELRRYCAAVIAAAETAAEISAVIKTPVPMPEDVDVSAFSLVNLTRRGGMILPDGYDISQFKAEQPTTNYTQFVRTKLAEIARCKNVPVTMMTLDSADANMSSRYIDNQIYVRDRMIDRQELNDVLDWLFGMWLVEARATFSFKQFPSDIPHQWFWPSLNHHADPYKVAEARATNLRTGLTTLAREYSADGLDWEQEQETAARTLGITVDEYRRLLLGEMFPGGVREAAKPKNVTEVQDAQTPT